VPEYIWGPSGGIRVVYEYANGLARRGHEVTVIQPRGQKYLPPSASVTPYRRLRKILVRTYSRFRHPSIDWQPIDKRVQTIFVPDSSSRYIPDGDAIFATGWHTVRSVLECTESKGKKCYLIQGYEVWQGPKEIVDATWRAPLHKVVIAKWLLEVGKDLGCEDLTYIPNAIDHDRYRMAQPIEGRARQVAMLFSTSAIKGSAEGIVAIEMAKKKYPDLRAVFFSTHRRASSVPEWVQYYRNPPQDFIIDEIYNKSQIFLAPSWTEGYGFPPAEAACCGCALVATDIGGFREYMQNGVTALLSPPKESTRLAENLCLLLGNDELRQRLAIAANKSVTQFNWERSTELLEHFLARVTQSEELRAQPV
jgi:glycosyltransferase involved in cell wall biosynthesis